MIYSSREVNAKLDSLLEYSKSKWGSQYHTQLENQIDNVRIAISTYLKTKKNDIAKKLEEFIHSYLWYSSNNSQECENDAYLGIKVPELQTFYFINDFRLLTTNDCFNFETIMNTDNETFNKAWFMKASGSFYVMANSLIGYDTVPGWIDGIIKKREIELANVKKAIADMEDNFWEIPDVIETFEDRGSPKSDFKVTIDSSPKSYKVLVKTIDGERLEERYGSNTEYVFDPSATIEGTAKLIYLPEFKGMFDVIRCLDLYDINDFASNSKPCSTYGSNKVYIPSYLKDEFKKLL